MKERFLIGELVRWHGDYYRGIVAARLSDTVIVMFPSKTRASLWFYDEWHLDQIRSLHRGRSLCLYLVISQLSGYITYDSKFS